MYKRQECGSDRILLQNALNTLLQPEAPVRQPEPQPVAQPVRSAAPAEEPTRIVGAAQEEATRIIPPRAAEPAPSRSRPLTILVTLFSLPGMGLAEIDVYKRQGLSSRSPTYCKSSVTSSLAEEE